MSGVLRRGIGVAALLVCAAGCASNPGTDPANDEFQAAPEVCSLLTARAVGDALGVPQVTPDGSGDRCTWSFRGGAEGPGPSLRTLSVRGTAHRSNGETSGSDLALAAVQRAARDSGGRMQDVSGVGDAGVRGSAPGSAEYVLAVGNISVALTVEGRDFDGASVRPVPADVTSLAGLQLGQQITAALRQT